MPRRKFRVGRSKTGLGLFATAEFKKATGILGGLWEKVRERPAEFLDQATIDAEGLDAATRDFVAGMTDRYAVRLFERLFIPTPWVEHRG